MALSSRGPHLLRRQWRYRSKSSELAATGAKAGVRASAEDAVVYPSRNLREPKRDVYPLD